MRTFALTLLALAAGALADVLGLGGEQQELRGKQQERRGVVGQRGHLLRHLVRQRRRRERERRRHALALRHGLHQRRRRQQHLRQLKAATCLAAECMASEAGAAVGLQQQECGARACLSSLSFARVAPPSPLHIPSVFLLSLPFTCGAQSSSPIHIPYPRTSQLPFLCTPTLFLRVSALFPFPPFLFRVTPVLPSAPFPPFLAPFVPVPIVRAVNLSPFRRVPGCYFNIYGATPAPFARPSRAFLFHFSIIFCLPLSIVAYPALPDHFSLPSHTPPPALSLSATSKPTATAPFLPSNSTANISGSPSASGPSGSPSAKTGAAQAMGMSVSVIVGAVVALMGVGAGRLLL
ncbi:hypothetical protein FB451DRAFT_1422398 [Mycena latifolia]|nr:hypothetical protein FB451DRAFT_1422398 [Mycena latifolia]